VASPNAVVYRIAPAGLRCRLLEGRPLVVRVLAVDDDPTILRLLEVNLEMDGHEVHTADNGQRGPRPVARWSPTWSCSTS
jgi:PleD family two-component response regulator